MARYHLIACNVLWREFCYFAAQSPNQISFDFLRQGLHNTPEVLAKELQSAVDAADEAPGGLHDAILLGYGLCCNGLIGLTARRTRLVAIRAHDCITILLGSKERYQEYFDKHPGTYWYSPGWIEQTPMPGKERYEALRRKYLEKYDEEEAEYLLRYEADWVTKYNQAAYVDVGVGDTERHAAFTRECADWLGWKSEVLRGDPRLIRGLLDGQWNSEDYLIVEPGQRVKPSYDERIITTENT
jgi:hypothetical protein